MIIFFNNLKYIINENRYTQIPILRNRPSWNQLLQTIWVEKQDINL